MYNLSWRPDLQVKLRWFTLILLIGSKRSSGDTAQPTPHGLLKLRKEAALSLSSVARITLAFGELLVWLRSHFQNTLLEIWEPEFGVDDHLACLDWFSVPPILWCSLRPEPQVQSTLSLQTAATLLWKYFEKLGVCNSVEYIATEIKFVAKGPRFKSLTQDLFPMDNWGQPIDFFSEGQWPQL